MPEQTEIAGSGKLLVELARLYGAGDSKVVDLSATTLPFLVIHIAYLISASWLPRIGLATRTGVSGYTRSESIQATKKSSSERKKVRNGRV